ncbi:hypothetical protein PF006_g19384 [Phytophthora fragariae]|uniref:Crinkler effector protein N-terminal domain-containing protein n=2 Tax=Phytophthora fragariae TaxID=53985 RepID=A0A6A3SG98_9STRA|nr:hypothetical protein PF003_g7503 [Phytophthora fragariae]KAE9114969.1 hypothetical protein PF006_g19384 [Phytophthora fragariae]KAE9200316.1 hypothetical protein PF004_g19032 [Phytophthora fragariae]
MWTVGYSYNGVVQTVSVPPRAIGFDVREALAVELDLPANGMKLMVLRSQLEDLPGVDAVQLRVEARPPPPVMLTAPDLDLEEAAAQAEAFDIEDKTDTESGSTSSHATTVTKLNSAFTKCRKRKATSQSAGYSSCNAEFMEEMTADLKKIKYKQEDLELPAAYLKQLKTKYRSLVVSSREPWCSNEATRRVFIDDILTTCVTAVKDGDKTKADLFLNYEKRVDDPEVDASGTADYVITLGTRMVIVIEAKKCDMEHALRQNFAAMEVARVLNGKKTQDDKDGWRDIQGICTDYQNWIFRQAHINGVRDEAHGVQDARHAGPRPSRLPVRHGPHRKQSLHDA